jgi:hypothetical protein
MACVACGGGNDNCKSCAGRGEIEIIECPKKHLGEDISDLLVAADMAKEGSWFMPGGWGQQPAALVSAIRRVWSEDEYWKARMLSKVNER